MNPNDIFANVMVLFWILVQQVCLCYVKRAYEDISGRGAPKGYFAVQGVFFLCLVLLGFDRLLGIDIVYGNLPRGGLRFYQRLKWNFFCEVMLVLDAWLVAYGWRIYRLYMSDIPRIPSLWRVRLEDIVVACFFVVPFVVYHWGMATTILKYGLPTRSIWAIQFLFIRFSGFFYALFEGAAAVLLWKMYRKIRKEGLADAGI